MPRIEVEGLGRFEVDESFLRASPQEQEAALEELRGNLGGRDVGGQGPGQTEVTTPPNAGINVRMPDGTVLEFPHGTADAVILRVIREQLNLAKAETGRPVPPAHSPRLVPVEDSGQLDQWAVIAVGLVALLVFLLSGRRRAVWFFGLLAGAIFGGLVGFSLAGWFASAVGVIGGIATFACVRLWRA